MRMNTLIKTVLIFTVALLSINSVKAQKVDKKAARMAAYQKMIDTADFTIIMEKAFPKNMNQILLSGSPYLSISHGVAECNLPYYGGDKIINAGIKAKFHTTNFDYQSQKTVPSTNPYQYNMLITPKPGTTDMTNVAQIVVSIITEDVVQVQVIFTDPNLDPIGFQGYIQKYKKMDDN
ncbi:MAG: hypothetical protein JWR23_2520 [Mucilaginibacter sp.]|nr:hypothetical protein [Mucilaginibacter sp.]